MAPEDPGGLPHISSGELEGPDWTLSGDDKPNAHFGRSVSSAGDVSGDGYGNVIVGAVRGGRGDLGICLTPQARRAPRR